MNESNNTKNLEMILSNQSTKTYWIKFQLSVCGSSLVDISKRAKRVGWVITPQAVGQLINGKFKNRIVEEIISEVLQLPANQLFPENSTEEKAGKK